MKNRGYIGDGVYACLDGSEVVLELEQGRGIRLNRATFHALVEYIHKHDKTFDPQCQLVEIPHVVFDDIVKELRVLETAGRADVKPTLDS